MPQLFRFLVLGRKSDATPLAALLLGAFIYCAFAASHHNLAASQPAPPSAVVLSIPTVADPSLPTVPLALPSKATVAALPPPPMQAAPASEPQAPVIVNVARTEELASVFDSHNYTLGDIRSGEKTVPPLALDRLPEDLGQVPEVEKRKMLFIQALLPIVLQTNERIAVDRRRLNWLRDAIAQDTAILPGDQLWLVGLAERYGTSAATVADLDELLRRVDVVPPSLAIAQAITESGWGTSYPARVGNALFGQFHFSVRGGRTAVGVSRPGTFQMRAYATLSDAVEGYVLNLNTHPAYRGFRLQRAKLRNVGDTLDGYALASTLLNYSELGMQYVNAVRLIMRTEKLVALDDAKLDVF
jgi:Bax protein